MRNSVIARLSLSKKALLLASGTAVLALPLLLGLPNVPVALAQSALMPPPPPAVATPDVPAPTARPSFRIARVDAPVRTLAVRPATAPEAEPPAAELASPAAPPPQVAQLPTPPAGPCVPSSVAATHTMPPYPPISRRLGEIGTVEMRVTIAPDGVISDAAITRSSGAVRLDEAAIAHVRGNWLWEPNNCGAQTAVRVVFSLLDAH